MVQGSALRFVGSVFGDLVAGPSVSREAAGFTAKYFKEAGMGTSSYRAKFKIVILHPTCE